MIKLLFISITSLLLAQNQEPVVFAKEDAQVWVPQQQLRGTASGLEGQPLKAYHNGRAIALDITPDGTFQLDLILTEKENNIWVESKRGEALSDTLNLDLKYTGYPIVEPIASVKGDTVFLSKQITSNPMDLEMEFRWSASASNPSLSTIEDDGDGTWLRLPSVTGDYFFNLEVISREDTIRYQTKVTRTTQGIEAFDLESTEPSWIDEAVIYEITPYSFVSNGTFKDITQKLPEIRELGINTIWLQPIFPTQNGWQGYDVINYRGINEAFGTEEDLRELIGQARSLGMRVLLDVVYNHSSISHPYAQDRIENKERSHYYDYYQHQDDGKPYSSFYNLDENQFINYFWPDLVNLNYNNQEVQRWILESAKYWVRNFDIDGYRLDAIWGVHSRNPEFISQLRRELKSIKPDFLLLAEAKGSKPNVLDLGYDAAYDWTADTTWVSQWSWEYEFSHQNPKTLFNHPEPEERGELLREALFENGGNMNRRLYHIENNDVPSFIRGHGLEKTKMAAALVFSMPGIPMLYNGQEIGFQGHPYSTRAYFDRGRPIKKQDSLGLFKYYQDLIQIHNNNPALRGGCMEALPVGGSGALVGFRRWNEDQHILVLINLDEQPHTANLNLKDLPVQSLSEDIQIKDLLSGQVIAIEPEANTSSLSIAMEGHSLRWITFKDP